MSSTTGPNFPNFATSPTMRTSEARPRASSSARASSVRPSSGTKALSTPIRVLLPPARMKAVTSGMGRSYTPPPCALRGLHHDRLPNPEYPRGGTPQRKHPQANPLYSNALSPRQRSPVHEGNLFKRGGSGEDEPCVGVRPGSKVTIMPQKLMDVLMLGRCSHEFSWPRRSATGEYYQVCLLCATAYQYDWKTMRRGNRVDDPVAETMPLRRRSGQKQPTWMPRARRLKSSLPIRYRGKNLSTWYEGVIQNISQSGVLFHGP